MDVSLVDPIYQIQIRQTAQVLWCEESKNLPGSLRGVTGILRKLLLSGLRMRFLYFVAGLLLMVVGIYFLGQNILFTTHAYPWWRGIAADLSVISLCVGIFMMVFLKGDAQTLGWIAIVFGIVCVFVSSRAILTSTSLWQFFLALGSMSVGYKMMTTQRSPF